MRIGSDASTNIGKHDGCLWVRVRLDNLIVSSVSVPMKRESDNVLESLHQGSVTSAKLVLALVGCIVRDHECEATLRLNVKKLLLKPCKLMAWVFTLAPNVPIQTVAGLRVVGNHMGTLRERLAV